MAMFLKLISVPCECFVIFALVFLCQVTANDNGGPFTNAVSISPESTQNLNSVDVDTRSDDEKDATLRYSWLMELFNHRTWTRRHYLDLSTNCTTDLDLYLHSLRNGHEWAEKMFDASGRYNSQFFFGNDYWLGSYKFCTELNNDHEKLVENGQTTRANYKTPPFSISFTIGRVSLHIKDDSPQARLVLVGECLPSSCSSNDVTNILYNSAKDIQTKTSHRIAIGNGKDSVLQNATVQLKIINVKPLPGPYSLWDDVAFYIVSGVGSCVVLLMLLASAFEYYINYTKNNSSKPKDVEIECQNNNYTHISENGGGSNNSRENGTSDTNEVHQSNENSSSQNVSMAFSNIEKVEAKGRKLGTGLFSQILLSFSIFSNTNKIMKTEESCEDTISCIHGIRFFSLMWVIMVHTYLTIFNIADNKTLRTITERNFFYQTVGNASYSVDTFFFISGFLLSLIYQKSMTAKKAAKSRNTTERNGDAKKQISKLEKDQYGFSIPITPQSPPAIGQQTAQVNGGNTVENTNTKFTRRTCSDEIKESACEFSTLLFYRFIRLTPIYLFVIGLDNLLLKYGQNNSVFEPHVVDHITCDKYWWRNILYINNFFPNIEMCMLWTWYLANDTQFYIVGIILLILAKRYFKFSVITLFVFMVSSWFITGYISLANDYKAKIQEPFALFDELYDKPWSRIGPYFIGMITGWYVHKRKGQINIPWWISIICWILAAGIMSSLIYGMADGYLESWPTAFYVSIGHTAWGIAVAWVVLFCLSPQGTILNKALSYRGILPLSRLTYCAYLIHPTIMVTYTYQLDGPFHLHNGIVLIVYAGSAVMSFLMSFVISLGFEAPVVRLLKISLSKDKSN